MCVKTLLTIHRNMKVRPNPNFQSISHIGSTMDAFFSDPDIARAYEEVRKSGYFKVGDPEQWKAQIKHSYDDKGIKLPTWIHPFAISYPPVDSNDRSGGREAPMRINSKSGPNGPSLGTQCQDLCGLKHREP